MAREIASYKSKTQPNFHLNGEEPRLEPLMFYAANDTRRKLPTLAKRAPRRHGPLMSMVKQEFNCWTPVTRWEQPQLAVFDSLLP